MCDVPSVVRPEKQIRQVPESERRCAVELRKTTDKNLFALPLLAMLVAVGITGCHMAADSQNLQGVRLFQQGQMQPALQEFQQAVATDPKNADAHYNLAATTHRLGIKKNDPDMLSQAEALYNQCLDIDEQHADCYRGLAVLLVQTDRPDRAFTLLKNWATTHPEVADARVELARLYQEFGDLETAKLHLNNAILADQSNARAWAALGSIREQMGDTDQALANYQRSLNLNQFQGGISERIAALQRSRGDLGGQAASGTRTVVTPNSAAGRY